MSVELVEEIRRRIDSDEEFQRRYLKAPLRTLGEEYTLSEEETYAIVLPNFGWVLTDKLAGSSYPYPLDGLILMQRAGVKALLNLTPDALPAALLAFFGLQAQHIPIADLAAPTIDQIEQAIQAIDHFIAQNLPVAVHCMFGIGRTGTILACYFVANGVPTQQAIKMIRDLRPGSIEMPEQEAVIAEYEQHWLAKLSS